MEYSVAVDDERNALAINLSKESPSANGAAYLPDMLQLLNQLLNVPHQTVILQQASKHGRFHQIVDLPCMMVCMCN